MYAFRMKTVSQIKFDSVIKEGFQELLKPLGFKKKANNFYLQLDSLGQIINVQKSRWGTREISRLAILSVCVLGNGNCLLAQEKGLIRSCGTMQVISLCSCNNGVCNRIGSFDNI